MFRLFKVQKGKSRTVIRRSVVEACIHAQYHRKCSQEVVLLPEVVDFL